MSFSSTQESRTIPSPTTPIDEEHIKPGDPRFGLIWQHPARVSGTPCFHGTRVPVNILFDHLAAGDTLEKFLTDFEGVTREQAVAVLQLSETIIIASGKAA